MERFLLLKLKIMNKLKKKLLTKLFTEWLDTETDVELLDLTTVAIKKRRLAVAGPTKVIGFKRYMDTAA
tara:strand:+ start:284 stop:490 length:207 start_codon:yes stop_codon:yes gene_type:complete